MAAALDTDRSGRGAAAGEGMVVGRMDAFVGGGGGGVLFGFVVCKWAVAVGAAEGDLAGWRGDGEAAGGGAGEFGGLDVEADAGVGCVPRLHGVAVGFFPLGVALVGEVAGAGEGHCEGGGLDVVGFVDIFLE